MSSLQKNIERRHRAAFAYFCRLKQRGYTYNHSLERAAKKFFYSPTTLVTIIHRQRLKLREDAEKKAI